MQSRVEYAFAAPHRFILMPVTRRSSLLSIKRSRNDQLQTPSGLCVSSSPSRKIVRARAPGNGASKTTSLRSNEEVVAPYHEPLLRGKLLSRYKRFLADVELPGVGLVQVHCPNPGSMRGMGLDGMPDVLVSEAPSGSKRKMTHTLEAVQVEQSTWVGCNTVLPNAIVATWLATSPKAREMFGNFVSVRREVRYGCANNSRIDFLLEYESTSVPSSPLYVEVKNVTMSWDSASKRIAVFPDSKTERGQKHLRDLIDLEKKMLGRACCLYFINRCDASAFAPCTVDMKYVKLFDEARDAGVRIYPLEFALKYDEKTGSTIYEYVKELPIHPEPGP